MKVESKKLANGDLEVKLTFDAHDQICLSHDLVDIVEWYSKGPSSEKIHNCRKRMINENRDVLLKSPSMQSKTLGEINTILSDEVALCRAITQLSTYKDRATRELK